MRLILVAGFSAVAFAVGVWAAPMLAVASDGQPTGHALKCVAHTRVCVGMQAEQVLSSSSEENLGGLIGIYCGFEHPGGGVGPKMNFEDVITGGCGTKRYVGSFSDGRHLTSVWVDGGVVVQLDRVPRHSLDL